MTDGERQLSRFFHEEADKATLPGAMFQHVLRRARIRRGVTAAMAGLAVIAIGMATVVGAQAFRSSSLTGPFPASEGGQSSPKQAASPSTCTDRPRIQEVDGAYGMIVIEATTPVVKIASGEREGKAWLLCAYRAMVKKNDDAPSDSLCEEFKFGPGPYSGYACLNLGASAPAGADYFMRAGGDLSKEEGAAYYGAISQRVHRVVLRLRDETDNEATIFEPPKELRVDYRFFVGFAPSGEDVTVSVEDDSKRELEKEFWNAQDG